MISPDTAMPRMSLSRRLRTRRRRLKDSSSYLRQRPWRRSDPYYAGSPSRVNIRAITRSSSKLKDPEDVGVSSCFATYVILWWLLTARECQSLHRRHPSSYPLRRDFSHTNGLPSPQSTHSRRHQTAITRNEIVATSLCITPFGNSGLLIATLCTKVLRWVSRPALT